jgi:hypothetical protein
MAGLKFLLLLGELGAFEPSDEFFGLARKHRTANDFNPSKLFFMIYRIFEKHFVIFSLEKLGFFILPCNKTA